jgi:hypothetical protein
MQISVAHDIDFDILSYFKFIIVGMDVVVKRQIPALIEN